MASLALLDLIKSNKKLTEEEKELMKFQKYVDDFRKNIPEIYNQCLLLDDLPNKELNHYFSISNRTDGKTTNYLHFFIRLSLDWNLKFSMICRHYTLRIAFENTVIDTFETFGKELDMNKLFFKRLDAYTIVYYDSVDIGVIYDLNKASDLKLFSNYLKKFPILIYDEFLALEEDYVTDEFLKLATIYESIDRHQSFPIIGTTVKVFYLGNAVNFASPIIAGLDLFNKLENHPINTKKIYGDIILENHHNTRVNAKRNTKAFRREHNAMTTGQFEVNNHNIATEEERANVNHNKDFFYIKLRENYLRVTYNQEHLQPIILSVVQNIEPNEMYHFNMFLKDRKKDSKFLSENWYDVNHYKKYDNGLFKFDNTFSKNVLTDTPNFTHLIIMKTIQYYESLKRKNNINIDEKIDKDNRLEKTKKALMKKFLTDWA